MNKENLVKKMYFNYGLSVKKIADILEENELYISEIIENSSPIKMISSIHKYTIKRISAETYNRLSKKAILIDLMHMFTIEMQDYIESHGFTGISEIYYILSLFFGDSVEYDEYKSSYRYLFYIEVFGIEDDNLQDKYLVSLLDIKGSLEVFFVKITPGKTQDNYSTYHEKYANLDKREMKKIWFWFMAFVKNSIKYLKNNHLRIKPFYKTIEAIELIYGY